MVAERGGGAPPWEAPACPVPSRVQAVERGIPLCLAQAGVRDPSAVPLCSASDGDLLVWQGSVKNLPLTLL